VTEPRPEFPIVPKPVRAGGGTRMVDTPEPVDPGWGYNVGKAAWGRDTQLVALRGSEPMAAIEGLRGRLPAAPEPIEPLDTVTALGERIAVGDAAGLGAAFTQIFGPTGAILEDPTGSRVLVTDAIARHIIDEPKRWDGRERYWPLIPELVRDPGEIWVGFARGKATGRVQLRRRYVSVLRLGGSQVVALVTDEAGGMWLGTTFFRGKLSALGNARVGLRVYRRP